MLRDGTPLQVAAAALRATAAATDRCPSTPADSSVADPHCGPQLHDPTAHAEILAITQATQHIQNWRLNRAVMYVTKEPCPMCAGALVLARIQRVVWGMSDPIRGGAQSKFNILHEADLNHSVDVTAGILEEPCREIMQSFFQRLRSRKKNATKTTSDNA